MALIQNILPFMDMFFGDLGDDYASDYDDDLDSVDSDPFIDASLRRRGIGEDSAMLEENLHPLVFSLNKLKNSIPGQRPLPQLSSLLHEASTSKAAANVESLLDLAARTVAKTCSCEKLEDHNPPLDEALLRKVAFWAFPQDEKQVQAFANVADQYNINSGISPWKKGVEMYKSKRIKEMWQVGFMLTAYIYKYGSSEMVIDSSLSNFEVRVSLTFEQQRIMSSSCSECKDDVWCPHVVAAIIYRIKDSNQVRIHAPMTETLSTLTRDQLQKILQYAIQEDPAGILGKVFKHLDDIRDNNSELNAIPGAPDPTFGPVSSIKTQWQLSLDRLDKNILSDLREMAQHRSYEYYPSRSSFYPATYDLTEKVESRMFRYIQKALDLVQMKEMKSAVSIMYRVTRQTLHVMISKSPSDSPQLNRYCHDLARMYTMFMLYCGQHKYQTHLLKNLMELQIKSARLVGHKLTPSQWAELPPITEACQYKLKDRLSKGLFTEAICAQNVAPWPEELKKLLDGVVTVDESAYDEDVRIMLARLECLLYLEDTKHADIKLAKLSAKILRKLARQAIMNSILGPFLAQNFKDIPKTARVQIMLMKMLKSSAKDVGFPACSSSHRPSTFTATKAARPASTPSRAAAQRRSPRTSVKRQRQNQTARDESPVPSKRAKKAAQPPEPQPPTEPPPVLQVSQVAYAMLYCCQNIIMCERSVGCDLENRDLLAAFCLLALELSRHRLVSTADAISSPENSWLAYLEQSVCQHLTSSAKTASPAINLYIDALRCHGAKFYKRHYPLVLTDIILTLAVKDEELLQSRKDILLHLCADFILDDPTPLELFRTRFSGITLSDVFSGKKYRDFTFTKFHTFIETYFSLLNADDKSHIALTIQVLRHFEKYKESRLLNAVNKDLRYHTSKFHDNKEILEVCLSVAVNAMKSGDDLLRSDDELHSLEMTRSYVIGLVAKLGAHSLTHLLGRWQGIMKCADIKKLLSALNLENTPLDLPSEAQMLLREYFEMNRMHGDTAFDMLNYYDPASTQYRQAVDTIYENATWYTVHTLFEIAKREYEYYIPKATSQPKKKKSGGKNSAADNPKPGSKTGASGETMVPEVFRFIEKAIINLGTTNTKNLPNLTNEYLVWAMQVCVKKSSDKYFSSLMSVIQEHVKNKPDVLIEVLHFAEKNKSVQAQVRPLSDCLIQSYNSYFVDRVSGSVHTNYSAVINDMRRARYHCIDHVPNGAARFDKDVIAVVKRFHSGKKKLLRMLDEAFSVDL